MLAFHLKLLHNILLLLTFLPFVSLAAFLAKGCYFNKIDRPFKIKNKAEFIRRPDEEIKKTIMALHQDGCKYNLLTNNCEHVATYIVYGVKSCTQVQ